MHLVFMGGVLPLFFFADHDRLLARCIRVVDRDGGAGSHFELRWFRALNWFVRPFEFNVEFN